MRRLSLLSCLLLIPLIFIGSATAIILLSKHVDNRRHEERILAKLSLQATQMNALEWECVAKQIIEKEQSIKFLTLGEQAKQLLRNLREYNVDKESTKRIGTALSNYLAATELELSYISAGKITEAKEIDEHRVDPAYDELSSTIEFISTGSHISAQRATTLMLVGSVLLMIFSSIAIGFLFWRFENARKNTEIILAEKRTLSRNEANLREYANETASLYCILDITAREIGKLMKNIAENNDYSVRFENQYLQRCWEVKNCEKKDCPAYGRVDKLRCWENEISFCHAITNDSLSLKVKKCRCCEIYKAARKDSVSELGESFNEMILMIADRQHALEQANHKLEDAVDIANKMTVCAEVAATTKSEFLANMSHEIRTPMTAILGYTEIIIDLCADKETLDYLLVIKRNGEHLLQIINDILDLSKIEAGKMILIREVCSPVAILNEVKTLMQIRADFKGLGLILECLDSTAPLIYTDPVRLRQILINMIGNAIKFTDVGSINILLKIVDGDGALLQCDVCDTGIGMTPEQIAQLFQPFSQGNTTSTRKFGGTGLGLVISKRLAEQLGGELELISSVLGVGTRFRLTLPVEVPNSSMSRSTPIVDPAIDESVSMNQLPLEKLPRLNYRILLAEDGPDNQHFITFILKQVGAEVVIAENGKKALDISFATQTGDLPFDLVIMDMQMPVMDGYEATRALREKGYTGPILALTAHAMADDRQKCLDAGCNEYLSKPLSRTRLVLTIAKMMPKICLLAD